MSRRADNAKTYDEKMLTSVYELRCLVERTTFGPRSGPWQQSCWRPEASGLLRSHHTIFTMKRCRRAITSRDVSSSGHVKFTMKSCRRAITSRYVSSNGNANIYDEKLSTSDYEPICLCQRVNLRAEMSCRADNANIYNEKLSTSDYELRCLVERQRQYLR